MMPNNSHNIMQRRFTSILKLKNRPTEKDMTYLARTSKEHGGRFDFNIHNGSFMVFSFEDGQNKSRFDDRARMYLDMLEGENL